MKRNQNIIILGAAFLTFACTDKQPEQTKRLIYPQPQQDISTVMPTPSTDESPVTAEEYLKWIENNRSYLANEKQLGNLNFAVLYKPLDLMVLSDMDTLDFQTYQTIRSGYDSLQYYVFSIGLTSNQGDLLQSGLDRVGDYTELIKYMAYELQHSLMLEEGGQKLNCKLFHFERTFGTRPYVNFMVGFERTPVTETAGKTFIYEDKIYNVGTVKLNIVEEIVLAVPHLKIPQAKQEGVVIVM